MNRIILIAPSQQMAECATAIIQEKRLPVSVRVGAMGVAKDIAAQEIAQGAKILLSRGGTASLLQQYFHIPVINVKFTSGCYIDVFEKIRRTKGKVAFFSGDEIQGNVRTLCYLMNVQAEFYRFHDEVTAEAAVLQAVSDGNVLGVGGALTGKYAYTAHLDYFTLENSREDIEIALESAQVTLSSLLLEETKQKILQLQLQRYEAIFNYTHDGIIAIDKQGKVEIVNKQAEKMLPLKNKPYEGKAIEEVLPSTKMLDVLRSGEMETDELMKVENMIINTNRIPLLIDGQIEGVVATFRDIESIRISEQKIRSNLYKKGIVPKYRFADILGSSPAIQKTIQIAKSYAKTEANILLIGEIGTGKEMFAHSIHRESQRKNQPFVTVNCASLSSISLLADLQGYEEGAGPFGAKGKKEGIFEVAHGGTVFLDNVSAAPVEVQVFLLRLLENKEVQRIGGTYMVPVDVRIIAATHKPLLQEIGAGNFLEELYYVLSVLVLEVPPLRERGDDALLLCNDWFRRYFGMDYRRYAPQIQQIEDYMQGYEWTGNVRQLSNFVERVGVLLKNNVSIEDILSTLPGSVPQVIRQPEDVMLERWTRDSIIQALSACRLNISQTARMLRCSRSTLYKKMEEFNVKITNIK